MYLFRALTVKETHHPSSMHTHRSLYIQLYYIIIHIFLHVLIHYENFFFFFFYLQLYAHELGTRNSPVEPYCRCLFKREGGP